MSIIAVDVPSVMVEGKSIFYKSWFFNFYWNLSGIFWGYIMPRHEWLFASLLNNSLVLLGSNSRYFMSHFEMVLDENLWNYTVLCDQCNPPCIFCIWNFTTAPTLYFSYGFKTNECIWYADSRGRYYRKEFAVWMRWYWKSVQTLRWRDKSESWHSEKRVVKHWLLECTYSLFPGWLNRCKQHTFCAPYWLSPFEFC